MTGKEDIRFEGKAVSFAKKTYVVLNKPAGVVTTIKDRFAEKKIIDLLPENLKMLKPAGRLDKDTTGLIILTNDGDLAFRLTHPSFEVEKRYDAVLDKSLRSEDRKKLEKGVLLDGEKTFPAKINMLNARSIEIIIHEGKKRQIRRMFFSLGYKVLALRRTSQGPLDLSGLKEGSWRFLTDEELKRLKQELRIS